MSRRVLLALLLLVGLVAGACGGDDAATIPTPAAGDGGGGDGGGGDGGGGGGGGGDGSGDGSVILTVYVGDQSAAWTLAELEAAVIFVEEDIDGDVQNGPRLLDVLEASGVGPWETAEVLGRGEGRSFEVSIRIASADVTDGWILDVTNRGTLKLAAEDLARERWVRDVGEIRIP